MSLAAVALGVSGCGEQGRELAGADVEATLPKSMGAGLDGLDVSRAQCVELTPTRTRCFARGTGPAGPFELPVTVDTRDGRSTWVVAETDLEGARNGTERKPLALGEAVTVVGERDVRVGVRVRAVRDPLELSDREIPPQPGGRYIGVEVRLSNMGTVPYSDTPLSTMSIRLDDGELLVPAVIYEGPCRASTLARVYVLPGNRVQGCAAFEVPYDSRPKSFAVEVASSRRILEWNLVAGTGDH